MLFSASAVNRVRSGAVTMFLVIVRIYRSRNNSKFSTKLNYVVLAVVRKFWEHQNQQPRGFDFENSLGENKLLAE